MKPKLQDDVQRLWDLVRFKRHELFCDDEIISDKEYAALAQDHPAVERLETNDRLRKERDYWKKQFETFVEAAMAAGYVFSCGKDGYKAEHRPELATELRKLAGESL
jgi:hypothetical protein